MTLVINGVEVIEATGGVTVEDNITLTGGGTIDTTANGNVVIVPNGTGITVIGNAGTTSHSLGANDDLLVTGHLEVDGTAYFDSIAVVGNTYFGDNDRLYMGGGIATPDTSLRWNTTQTADGLVWGLGSDSNSLVICEKDDEATDFTHAQQTNPTVYIQSADATSVGQYTGHAHNQTDAVNEIGTGSKVTHHVAPVSLDDDASFTLPDASTGWGFFMAGDAEEYAQIVWTSAGAVTLVSNSANVATADTDTNLCFIDGGTQVSVKNRLGAAKEIMFDYHYTT